jgi:hypothetical protein
MRYPLRRSSGISFSISVVFPLPDFPTMQTMFGTDAILPLVWIMTPSLQGRRDAAQG